MTQPDLPLDGAAASLTGLPCEVLVAVASNLTSLDDVLAFVAVCARLRAVFQGNAYHMSCLAIKHSIECEDVAWTLLLAQENQPLGVARTAFMKPHHVLRLARNAHRLEKAIEWFHKNEMKYIRHLCLRLWGNPDRPPYLSRTERRRFEFAYYFAAALLEPNGQHLLETLPLRQLLWVQQVLRIDVHIGEERMWTGLAYWGSQRNLLQRACDARLNSLWARFYPQFDIGRLYIANSRSFGCRHGYLALVDDYQEHLEYALFGSYPPRGRPRIHFPLQVVKDYIWGQDSGGELETDLCL
ncbi:hypothetical protein S40293_11360 [Stachybotrys chartarum IBT 40293]|nr:hypothetical protein S40293_11360 [Stachybotrys chartarum IBT 40293]